MKTIFHKFTFRSAAAAVVACAARWTLLLLFSAATLDRAPGDGTSPFAVSHAGVAAAFPRRRRRGNSAEASAGYSRFSTEMQDETSIESQQERCNEAADRDGQAILAALAFADSAVSGTKLHREGLDALMKAAEEGRFNRLYFYSLSRLARESIIGMPILKRLVYVLKVRVISVTEGLDSNREGWETLAQILLMQHERYVKDLSANVFRGQKSNAKNGFSNGDYCLGYKGAAVAGSEQSRRGRHARPRMTYVIDSDAAAWVRRIFDWFVRERRSIRWITRELNRLDAPKDHRSKKDLKKPWRHQYVSRLLANRKYVGLWPWGEKKNVRDPETGAISQEDRPSEETEQYLRSFPELRLIDDETFAAAQAILADNRRKAAAGRDEDGRFVEGRSGSAPPPAHLLAGLVICGHCGRTLYVGGSNGKYLFCPGYAQGVCSCQTTLNRRLAERLILEQIGTRILADPDWLRKVQVCAHAAWRRLEQTLPDELRDAEAALADVQRKIARLVNLVEEQDQPDPDVTARLAERRADRRRAEDRLTAARAASGRQTAEPTEAWVREKIERLAETLAGATPAAAHALAALVGGRITVVEVRREGKKRHFLRGTLLLDVRSLATALGAAPADAMVENHGEEITIDFVAADPLVAKAAEAWRLHEEGLLRVAIAERLGCSKALVTKLLRRAARERNVPLPDGRSDRGSRQARTPPLYVRIAPEVGRLVEEGLLLVEIGERLGVDRTTLTKAYNKYRADQGLSPLDGRARRKLLPRKNRPAADDEPS